MAKAWGWCFSALIVIAGCGLVAESSGAKSHLVEATAPLGPSPNPDAPMITAGADLAPNDRRPPDVVNAGMAAASIAPVPALRETAAVSTPIQPSLNAPDSVPPRAAALQRDPAFRLADLAQAPLVQRIGAGVEGGLRQTAQQFSHAGAALPRRMPTQNLAKWMRQADDLRDKTRLFVFAGRGDQVLGYSLTRAVGWGLQTAGWSREAAAKGDDAQVGVAWRRGDVGLALVEVEHKMSTFGASVRDRVLGLRFSFKLGPRDQRA